MHTIVLASRKGGAGKTTLAAHLAVAADRSGLGKVVVIDADPMGGLATWWNARKSDAPGFSRITDRGMKDTLRTLKESGVSLVVIDTPPAASEGVAAIVASADLVVIPVIPSPNDLVAVGETLNIVEASRKPILFAINNASINGRLTQQAIAVLSEHGPVAVRGGNWVIVHTRQDFRSSMISGRTAVETHPKSRSGEEIAELWRCVQARLVMEAKRGSAT
jgi:chromosome partitioning protein